MLAGPKTMATQVGAGPGSLGSPVSSHTSATGDRPALNLPAWKKLLGFGTSGGRKKKNAFPSCAPSIITAIGAPSAAGCRSSRSRQPTESKPARRLARWKRFMDRDHVEQQGRPDGS